MTHFNAWEWTDFVSGTDGAGLHSEMSTHLAGCARCQRTVDTLKTVTQLAQREGGYEPPEHAIRYAHAIYSLYRPEKSGLVQLIARLMHDSGLQVLNVVPLTFGVCHLYVATPRTGA